MSRVSTENDGMRATTLITPMPRLNIPPASTSLYVRSSSVVRLILRMTAVGRFDQIMLFVVALVWYLLWFISQTDGSHGRANALINILALLCFPKNLSCTKEEFVYVKNWTLNSFRNSSKTNLSQWKTSNGTFTANSTSLSTQFLFSCFFACKNIVTVISVITHGGYNRAGTQHFSKKVVVLKKKQQLYTTFTHSQQQSSNMVLQ